MKLKVQVGEDGKVIDVIEIIEGHPEFVPEVGEQLEVGGTRELLAPGTYIVDKVTRPPAELRPIGVFVVCGDCETCTPCPAPEE